MATVRIEVPDEKAATYKTYAEAGGLTVEQVVSAIVGTVRASTRH
jgi:hypothetical protein